MLEKLSAAMGDAFNEEEGFDEGVEGQEAHAEGEEEEAGVHAAASSGGPSTHSQRMSNEAPTLSNT